MMTMKRRIADVLINTATVARLSVVVDKLASENQFNKQTFQNS